MHVFLDSGILLRVVHRRDPAHKVTRDAIRAMAKRRDTFCAGLQQFAEFWNVSTRPLSARGGFARSVQETGRKLSRIERGATVLIDTPLTVSIWKKLVRSHAIRGVQVHDARVVALMLTHSIWTLITLNKKDFE